MAKLSPSQRLVLDCIKGRSNGVTMEELVAMLFGGKIRSAPEGTVRTHVSQIRKVLGSAESIDFVLTSTGKYVYRKGRDPLPNSRSRRGQYG